jgi:hypothetical protein
VYSAIPYITFFTSAVQADFWQVLRAVLFVGMPLFIIKIAFEFGGDLLGTIVRVFTGRRDKEDHYDIED